jgi:ParB/RepB/Spo0J family partition protein
MTDAARRRYDFRVVSIDAIDPPERAMREQMDDDELDKLAANIKRNGILQPPGVVPVGDRFRISWGHRRLVAAQMAGEHAIPVRVLLDDDVQEEEFKYAENTFRENVNPAEEATWLADLLEHKHGGDLDSLCLALNLKESTVNGRLDLLRGDDQVRAALQTNKIGLGVARELNRMKEPSWRAYRLAEAIEQGSTERVVRDWRISDERTLAVQRATADGSIPAVPPSTEAPIGTVDMCLLCTLASDQNEMDYVKVHRSCLRKFLRELDAERRSAAS